LFFTSHSPTPKQFFSPSTHNTTNRNYNNFLPLNSPPISHTFLQTQFFPYHQPPFSPPKTPPKPRFFQQPNNPTIFLHQIPQLSPNTQPKLLPLLQHKQILRVRPTKPIPINLRVIP
ncbi:sigma 54-interacting transcriptional regulator, partial [Bacillus thuringiensis]|uniref:sigma 54-interacting transcriptional regulator n=1 Tax=Bacillus thuringiensis TaxID=1428 RepID=UPI0016427FA6